MVKRKPVVGKKFNRLLVLKEKSYPRYGGTGIHVCLRWRNKKNGFLNFLSDMGLRPSNNHSLERKNGHLGYFKKNGNDIQFYTK